MLAIDMDRVHRDIETLAGFTSGDGPGITRLTFSEEDRAARDYLRQAMEGIGMTVTEVPPGVMIGRLSSAESSDSPVMSGSHIDSVLNAGKFDGVLGVVGPLEVARVLAENRVALHHPFEVVIYPEEEGTRFGAVLTGSKAWVGQLSVEELGQMKDEDGISYIEAMKKAGFQVEDMSRYQFRSGVAKALIELHIEQSVVLEQEKIDVGIVTEIIGVRGFDITIQGVANHAGATPMPYRRDALAGAAEMMIQLESSAQNLGPHTVCTVGQITCSPGGRNIIPGEARFSVDFRDIEQLDERWNDIAARVSEVAERRRLSMDVVPRATMNPVSLSPALQDVLGKAAERRKLSYMRMPSGAVHDAQVMAPLVETCMIFVPSRDGRSHCPEEFTESRHIENGINLLLETALNLVH